MKWHLSKKKGHTYSEHTYVSANVQKKKNVYFAYIEGSQEMPCGRDFRTKPVECVSMKAAKDRACKMANSWDVVFGAYFDVIKKNVYDLETT